MSTDVTRLSDKQINGCTKCGGPGEFGYKIKGEMQWFCDKHRLSQNYADARTPLAKQKAATPTTTAEHKLAEHAEAIRALGKRAISDVIEMGRHLTEAKELCGHGNWSSWLSKEFGWAADTALNLMRCYRLSKTRNFRDVNLPVSGLYLLASPSTPEEARHEVLGQAVSGKSPSVADIKDAITEHKAKKSKSQLSSDKPKSQLSSDKPDPAPPARVMFGPIQYDLLDRVKPTIMQMNQSTKEALAIWFREICQREIGAPDRRRSRGRS